MNEDQTFYRDCLNELADEYTAALAGARDTLEHAPQGTHHVGILKNHVTMLENFIKRTRGLAGEVELGLENVPDPRVRVENPKPTILTSRDA